MRSQKEIEDKIKELYELAKEDKRDLGRVIIETDALCWVLGEDYLDSDEIGGSIDDNVSNGEGS